jgi:hypothetical protein
MLFIRRVKKRSKSQIPSTKSQINSKFENPLTQTKTAIGPYLFSKAALSIRELMSLGKIVERSLVWNLGHWNLFDIWNLVLGI